MTINNEITVTLNVKECSYISSALLYLANQHIDVNKQEIPKELRNIANRIMHKLYNEDETDLDKFKKHFDSFNIGYTQENDYNFDETVLDIRLVLKTDDDSKVVEGYYGFESAYVFDKDTEEFIKVTIYE